MTFRTQKKISLLGVTLTTVIYTIGVLVMFGAAERFIHVFSTTYNQNLSFLENFEKICSTNSTWIYLILGIISIIGLAKILTAFTVLLLQILSTKTKRKVINDQPAYTSGLIKPSIHIDESICTKFQNKEIKAIQLHEEFHRRNYDPLAILLVEFSRNLLPSFPGKKRLYSNLFLLFELAADEYVFSQMNSKKPLLSSLMKVIQLKLNKQNNLFVGFSNITDRRIQIHTSHSTFKFRFSLFHGFSIITLLVLIFLNVAKLNTADAFVCEMPEDCSSFETKSLTCS